MLASFQVSQYQVATSSWPYLSTQCFTHWKTSSSHFA